MKQPGLIIFLLGIFISCKTQYINAWKDENISCDAYRVTKIEMGDDTFIYNDSFDSSQVMWVTIIENSKYRLDGPDYCLFSVIDENNDTIARTAINGMPSDRKPRTYLVHCNRMWTRKPDSKKIRVSIPPYCNNIPIKIN